MTSIESTVAIFCNSVIGARSNRDGYFAVYAGLTGRYPLFGYHLDENRRGTMLFKVDAEIKGSTDFSCLGFHIGKLAGEGVPVVTGLKRRPTLDELDALGAGMATSGGVSLYILPQVTPPFASVEQAFAPNAVPEAFAISRTDIDSVYTYFCTGRSDQIDIIHVGCPHASFEEMREYANLLRGKKVKDSVEFWITTSRAVRRMAEEQDLLKVLEASGAKVIADTCPISCHFARTVSPDPELGVVPPALRTVLVDSAKQAKYVRDMIQCKTLLTGTSEAIESALSGRFVPRQARNA
jgi:predicted aconitase